MFTVAYVRKIEHPLVALRVGCAALAVFLGGCGFQLQGGGTLPAALTRTYLDSTEQHTEFLGSLTNALRMRGSEIVTSRGDADSVLKIVEDVTGQRVLSVSARNIPQEYEVFYQVTFALEVDGALIGEPESLVATRSYTYDETQVLAKSREELELRRALADDLARRVLRRIETIGAQATTAAAPRT
jgi:LPS-assembly lipoprotein